MELKKYEDIKYMHEHCPWLTADEFVEMYNQTLKNMVYKSIVQFVEESNMMQELMKEDIE